MPEVSALILNWNGAGDTLECVSSLRASSYHDFVYTVLDNGSTDDSLSRLRQALGPEHVHSVGRNKGYAGGMNEAIRVWLDSDSRFGLLLTNDVRLDPEALGILVEALAVEPRLGIVGPMIFNARDGSIFSTGGYVRRDGGQVLHYMQTPAAGAQGGHPRAVPRVQWLDGCCLLLRREVVGTVGGFDERFFAYVEDVDLCQRAARQGWEIGVANGARVSQTPGGTHSLPQREYYMVRNRLFFCRKNFGRWAMIRVAMSYLYSILRWDVLRIPRRGTTRGRALTLLAGVTGVAHGLLGRGGQLPRWLSRGIVTWLKVKERKSSRTC